MKINSIKTLMKFMLEKEENFIYRGQRDSSWPLDSTINRTAKKNDRLLGFEYLIEKYIIKEFKTTAHLFCDDFNNYKGTELNILTLAQHYGAPTRLLDTTASKFIALFFAFDDVRLSDGIKYVRIWRIDKTKLNERTSDILKIKTSDIVNDYQKTWTEHISQNKYEAIFYLEPEINSRRTLIQKGCFICSGKTNTSIYDIIPCNYKDVIDFVDINKSLYAEVFDILRNTNIFHQTLFGGIEGFSKDLKNRLLYLLK